MMEPRSYKVLFENDKVRVLEYVSRPGIGVCGDRPALASRSCDRDPDARQGQADHGGRQGARQIDPRGQRFLGSGFNPLGREHRRLRLANGADRNQGQGLEACHRLTAVGALARRSSVLGRLHCHNAHLNRAGERVRRHAPWGMRPRVTPAERVGDRLLSGDQFQYLKFGSGSTAGLRELDLVAADQSVDLTCHTAADQARCGRPSRVVHDGQLYGSLMPSEPRI